MQRVHFIGIGGYSMSGLALYLKEQGAMVTGSDMKPSSRTARLMQKGIPVQFGHDAGNVADADLIIYNTDVQPDNPERQAAAAAGKPLWHRSELLAHILENHPVVTISGTHGKTTTTSMTGTILSACGVDPTVLVGGEVDAFGGNLRLGSGPWMVVEADESDGSFLRYHPRVAIATNVEPEHLEHFGNRFDNLIDAFRRYLSAVPSDGVAVINIDDPVLRDLVPHLHVPLVTYGLNTPADIRGDDILASPLGTRFSILVNGRPVGAGQLSIPGRHNVGNALAALAAARHVGVPLDRAIAALSTFKNAQRRFQILWEGEVRVVDDYAHHPTEIRSTLLAARQVTPGRVLVAFQPQRYSRTERLWDGFAEAFGEADEVFLADIYSPPGERPIEGVSGERLAEAIRQRSGKPVQFYPNMFDMVTDVLHRKRPGDTFCTMGAGDIYRVAQTVADRLAATPPAGVQAQP